MVVLSQGSPHRPSSAWTGSQSAQGDGRAESCSWSLVACFHVRPCPSRTPSSFSLREGSSFSLPTHQRVGRKTSGPRHWGFWPRRDKGSVKTGGPLWRVAWSPRLPRKLWPLHRGEMEQAGGPGGVLC